MAVGTAVAQIAAADAEEPVVVAVAYKVKGLGEERFHA